MIINEDYFKDLEITDEDIIADDTMPDVEEPKHELTLDEFHKLPEQYDYCISIRINHNCKHTTFIKTTLISRLFKRLDTIFELYGIEDYKYVLVSTCYVEDCNTVAKLGNYQLFCEEDKKDDFINDTYWFFYINVYVNYPQFTYKRAFRFLYTVLNLYRNCKLIYMMCFEPITTNDYVIEFYYTEKNLIEFHYYNEKTHVHGNDINLCNELTEADKMEFYNSVFCHFFGEKVGIYYNALERDVPLKSYLRYN